MVRAKGLFADGQRPREERLGLGEPALFEMERGQAGQAGGHGRGIAPEHPLSNIESPLQQRQGLVVLRVVEKDDADRVPQACLGLRVVLEATRVDVRDRIVHCRQNRHVVNRTRRTRCSTDVLGIARL